MNIPDFINEYWIVISVVFAIIVNWVRMEYKVKEISKQEKRLSDIEDEVKELNPIFVDIRERLIAIETMMKYEHNHKDDRK